MKRYLLFGFNHYYPEGGWMDFEGSYDSVADAVADSMRHFVEEMRYTDEDRWDECHVIDSQTGKYVHGEPDGVSNLSFG